MRRLLRFLRSKGLDRSLAASELLSPGPLHSLWLGVRHIRGGEPSYWWLDAAFEERRRRSPGLPVTPVRGRTPFVRDADIAGVWQWVLDTTATRTLHAPNLDEQLWLLGSDPPLDARLAEAERTLAGPLTGLHGFSWEEERLRQSGFDLQAEFAGRSGTDRPARAMLYTGPDESEATAPLRQWAQQVAQARGIPFVCPGP